MRHLQGKRTASSSYPTVNSNKVIPTLQPSALIGLTRKPVPPKAVPQGNRTLGFPRKMDLREKLFHQCTMQLSSWTFHFPSRLSSRPLRQLSSTPSTQVWNKILVSVCWSNVRRIICDWAFWLISFGYKTKVHGGKLRGWQHCRGRCSFLVAPCRGAPNSGMHHAGHATSPPPLLRGYWSRPTWLRNDSNPVTCAVFRWWIAYVCVMDVLD